jgi:proliferating cell nuclear antigen
MFEAKLEDVALLRDSTATISELIDEAELHIKESGIEMISSDRAVVAVVDFSLSRGSFREYKYEADAKIGINLMNLLQILKRAQTDDILKIKLLENKLHLVLEGSSVRSFVLPLIEVSRDNTPPLDKLDFSTTFAANAEILNSGIEDAELISDSIVFTVRKDQLNLKAESDASSTQLDVFPPQNYRLINVQEPVRSRYSIDYLKKIFKARKMSQEVKIAMATDYPMKADFEIPGKMRLSFILAPRVEEA